MAVDLKIVGVHNASTPQDEWVLLVALADMNLHPYAVVDATFNADGSMSNEHRHVYFFPRKALKEGEYVVLFSGKGVNGTIAQFDDGGHYYSYYWQSGVCIWNNTGDNASLIKYYNGNSVKVDPVQ